MKPTYYAHQFYLVSPVAECRYKHQSREFFFAPWRNLPTIQSASLTGDGVLWTSCRVHYLQVSCDRQRALYQRTVCISRLRIVMQAFIDCHIHVYCGTVSLQQDIATYNSIFKEWFCISDHSSNPVHSQGHTGGPCFNLNVYQNGYSYIFLQVVLSKINSGPICEQSSFEMHIKMFNNSYNIIKMVKIFRFQSAIPELSRRTETTWISESSDAWSASCQRVGWRGGEGDMNQTRGGNSHYRQQKSLCLTGNALCNG